MTSEQRPRLPARTALFPRPLEPPGPLARSGALSRSGALARSGARERPGASGELGLLRCRVGPYTLLIQVSSLLNVDRPTERPAETGLRVLDLRRLLGVAPGPGQSLLFLSGPAEEPIELMVDPGIELCRADLSKVHPWPEPLGALPALRGLAGLIELDGGLAFLVDPHQLVRQNP